MKTLKTRIPNRHLYKSRLTWVVMLAVMAYALSLPSGYAQTVFGSITGTVTDPSGAVVPGAKVLVRGEQTGTTFEGTTTSAGSFNFPQVPVGSYGVTVTASGFQAKTLTGVQVNLQVTTDLKINVAVGTAVESVTVNANELQLQTATSSISGSITQEQYNKLPLALGGVGALRSPEAFIFLLPGNTGPGTANSPNGVFFSKIAGGQDYGAEVLIDGLSQQRSENGSSFDEEAPSVDALRELTVTQALPPAEYNRTTGGFENFATKSGSNSFHGSAYDIFRNTVLDANLWFNGGYETQNCSGANDTPSCRKGFATPVDQKNDYGVTFGGPVWIPKVYNGHDRLFFFFSWEHLQYNVGASTVATVPTSQELAGDFSNPAFYNPSKIVGTNPCDGSPVYQGEIFDPSTTRTVGGVQCRSAFPGNKITTPLSPAALNALSYFPAPTNGNVFNNFNFSSVSPIANTTLTIRIDANITQKSHLWSSYSSRDNNRVSGTPQILPYPIDPNTWKQDFETHFWRLGWDYSFTPALLNHLIIGSNRSNSINYAYPIFQGINYTQKIGIGNAVSFNFPQFTNGILTNEGNPAQNDDNIDNGLRAVESVSWQKGAHSLTFGTDDRYQQYSPINGNSPTINFCSAQTSAYTGSSNNGNALASELLGAACGGSQNIISHYSRWSSWYFSGYAQDDWKVSPNLTLNLGVNYSVDVPRHEAQNFTSNFSPTAIDPEVGVPGALVFGTECNGCNTKWADTYYKDIAPRVGFAYSPPWLNNNTVIHGGAGIIYGPLQYDDFGGSMNAGYKSSPVFPSKNGFDPSFQIDAGYPAFPAPPILDPGLYNGSFMPGSYIEKKAGRPAEIYDWDLEVQQQVVRNLVASIGYIGSAGQNLQANNQNINNVPYAKEFSTGGNTLNAALMNNPYGVPVPFPSYFNLWGNGVTIQQALRSFPQYDFIDSGCCLQATGHSSYEALLTSLRGQFKDLTLQVSYTWAKNLNDTDSALPNVNPGQPQVQNPANLKAEKAISVQDVPNTFVASYVYHLPFGRNERYLNSGPASYILGGWQIGGIQRYQDGQPLAFCCAVGIPGWQQAIRYDLTGTPIQSAVYRSGWKHINPFDTASGSDPNTNSFFNGSDTNGAAAYASGSAPTAFHDQVAAVNALNSIPGNNLPYTLGNTPRVTGVRMPAWMNEDFSLLKDTPIKESLSLQLKFDFLNAFNRHLFGAPDTNPADFTYGIPTYTANNPRQMQITATLTF